MVHVPAQGRSKRSLGSAGELFPQSAFITASYDENGRADFGKLRPLVYDSAHMSYRVVGEKIGGAWNVGRALV